MSVVNVILQTSAFSPFVFHIITFCNPHEHQVVCHYRNYNLTNNMFVKCSQEISIPSKRRSQEVLSWKVKVSKESMKLE